MKKYIIFFFLVFGFENAIMAARPTWEADLANNGNLPSTSMVIIAQLDIMGTPSNDAQDLIAAFVNGQLRGVGSPNIMVPSTGQTISQMQVYGNSGEIVTFKYYDQSADIEYTAVNSPIVFATNATLGSPSSPMLITANNYPTDIAISNLQLPENQPENTVVGLFNTADLDANDTLFTYSFVVGTGSANNTSFFIDGNQLKTAETFNFESKNFYSIRIQVTDLQGGAFEKAFTISITNANDPISDVNISNNMLQENSAIGTTIGTFSSEDEDTGNTHSYSLDDAGGLGADNNAFIIEGNTLKSNAVFNYELISNYQIQVSASDGNGSVLYKQLQIIITDVNDQPDSLQMTANTILENVTANNFIGDLVTFDQDINDSHTYTFYESGNTNDNTDFVIRNGNKVFSNLTFNYESDSLKEVDIRATDLNGLSVEKRIVIKVINQNDAPNRLALSANLVDENLAIGTFVGKLTTEDEDAGDHFTYSFVSGTGAANNNDFQLAGDSLKTNQKFDFETKSTYSIRIQTKDAGGEAIEQVFTIFINNANDTITDIQLSSPVVEENKLVGTVVGNFTSVDQDLPNHFTYDLVSGMGDADNIAFSIISNQLMTDSTFDFERKSSYSIRVKSTDQGGLAFEKIFNITIQNVNDAPTNILYTAKSIEENQVSGIAVAILSTADQDVNDTHTYTIVGGTGQGIFVVENNTLKTNEILDYEFDSMYTLVIETKDITGASFIQTDSIQVIDLNDPPTDIILFNHEIAENLPVGTALSQLEVKDSDTETQSFTFELINGLNDDDNNSFTITDNTLHTALAFNFEEKSLYRIRLRAIDNQGIYFEKPFNILITDVNDIPTALSLSANSIQENSLALIGTFSTEDEDLADSFHYSFVSGIGGEDNSSFVIDGNQLRTRQPLDHETNAVLRILVKTQDAKGESFTKAFTIQVMDINEKPVLSNATFDLQEFAENGQIVGQMTVSDVDENQVYSFISLATESPFSIDINTGAITLINQEVIDFEEETSYQFQVVVSDNGTPSLSDTATVVIQVIDEIETLLPVTNFVSPNNDGKNDFWAINSPDLYEGYELIIYDVNGEPVYQMTDYQNQWQGQNNSGDELPSGIYFYTFQKSGTQFNYKGAIHLVRSGR